MNENKNMKKTYNKDWSHEYWGINLGKLRAFEARLEKIEETNPKLGKELLAAYEDLMMFNIPIIRSDNGVDFVLTTDTGRVVGSGKIIEPLKDTSLIEMDYYLSEEADEDEVDKALAKIDILEDVK